MRIFSLFIFLWASLFVHSQTNPVIDSLENIIASEPHDTIKVLTYSDLCWEYRLVDQEKALENGAKAVSLARKLDYQFGLGKSLNDLSIIFIDKGSLDTAVVLMEEAKEIRTELNDGIGVAALDNKLGIVYELKMELEKAMEHSIAALEFYESIDYKVGAGYCMNNVGNIHQKMENFDKAIEVHSDALQLRIEINDVYGIAGSHSNLGTALLSAGDTTKGIYHFEEAIKIYRVNDYAIDLSVLLNSMAELYFGMGDLRKAEQSAEEGYEIRKKIEDARGIASSSVTLGNIYTELGKYNQAYQLLHEGRRLSIDGGYRNKEKAAYEFLARWHAKNGNADSTHYYYTRFYEIENEIYKMALDEKVNQLETEYEVEKTEKANEILAREKVEEENKRKSTELQLANRNLLIIGLSGGTLALVFLGLFVYQRKMKRAEEERNAAVLEEKQKGLEAVFEATEEERQRIAKDLHDGVGQQMSGLKLAFENLSVELKQSSPENSSRLDELNEVLNDAAHDVREISHRMMPKVLSEFGLISALTEMLDKSLKLSNIKYEFEHFNINGRFDQKVEISLFRICQELINNVIKHSGASEAAIQLFTNKKQLILIVEDNGKGFEQDDSDGHGLLNIKSRLNTINGEVNYEASTQKGTMATVRIAL